MNSEVRSRVRNLKFTNIQFKLKIKHRSFLSTMKSALQLAGSSSDTMSSSSSAPLFCSFPPPPPPFTLQLLSVLHYWTYMELVDLFPFRSKQLGFSYRRTVQRPDGSPPPHSLLTDGRHLRWIGLWKYVWHGVLA